MKETSAPTYSVVRIRPASAVTSGLSDEELTRIGDILTRRTKSETASSTTFAIAPGTPAFDQEIIVEISEFLARSLRDSAALIVDMNYDLTIDRYGVLDFLAARALVKLAEEVSEDHRVVMLLQELPVETDELTRLASYDRLQRFVGIIDSEGNADQKFDLDMVPRIEEILKSTARRHRSGVESKILRRRGVFEWNNGDSPSEFYHYQYSANDCTRELQALFEAYFAEENIDFAVYDEGPGSTSFAECLQAAAKAAKVDAFSIADYSEPAEGDDEGILLNRRATEYIRNESAEAVLIVPAVKTGRALQNLRSLCDTAGRTPESYKHLTVVLDEGFVGDREISGISLGEKESYGYGNAAFGIGDTAVRLHYFLKLPIRALPVDSWQVSAAKKLNEVENPKNPRRIPTRVAMWSLIESYDAGEETNVPTHRDPVAWFPIFHKMQHADAYWLAKTLVCMAEDTLNYFREKMLIIMPEEDTGAGPIAECMENDLDIRVVAVPRSVIKGDSEVSAEDYNTIAKYSALKIVIADESTVTYDTIKRLGDLVESITARRPDLNVCVIEATKHGIERPANIVSLCRWRPVRWAKREP